MKCSTCKTENTDGVKFCKSCGAQITEVFASCPNGHRYPATSSTCPFCPSETESGRGSGTVIAELSENDRTIIDDSAPTLQVNSESTFPITGPDATMLLTPVENQIPKQDDAPRTGRKLVGWLVTFDINPLGTDFRITEGRTKLGRNNTNDIILVHPGVSDEHALMLYREGKLIIDDKLSTNGTFVNGESIEDKTHLKNDDIIGIGDVRLKVKLI